MSDKESDYLVRNMRLREQNAKLREELEKALAEEERLMIESVTQRERAEAAEAKVAELEVVVYQESIEYAELMRDYVAAEAKLKAASGPIGYVTPQVLADLKKGVRYGGARITPRVDEEDGCIAAIYSAPIPPADVQWYKDLLAKSEEKSAQQYAEYQAQQKRIAELERKLAEQQATVQNFFGMYARELPDVGEELNTLLAKAREEGRIAGTKEFRQV